VRRRLLALLAVAAAAAAAATPVPVRAQVVAPAVELRLTAISPATGPRTPLAYRLAVRNRGRAVLRDLRVDASIGQPVGTRSELAALVAGQPGPTRPLESWPSAVPEVPAGASVALEPRTVPLPPGTGASRAGAVLPVVLQLRAASDAGPVATRLTTFVVVVSEQVANPLTAALLVPLREPTHRDPKGVFLDDGLAGQLAPDGPLGAIVAELDRPKAPTVTLVVDPLLAEDASAMPGGWRLKQGGATVTVAAGDRRSRDADLFLRRLRAAAGAAGNPPSAFPYAGADLPALVRAGFAEEAAVQVFHGRRRLRDALGSQPDETLAWPVSGAIDAATLRTLDNTGAEMVVLDAGLLPTTAPTTQNATVDLGGISSPQKALVPDPGLAAVLADQRVASDPAAWAQRVLAETAVAWLERPNNPARRGILLAPPQVWRPHPRFFRALVRGLAAAPWLRLRRATDLADRVGQGPDPAPRELVAAAPEQAGAGLPASYLRGVAAARESLTSFGRAAGPGFRPDAGDWESDLRIAESSDWRPAAARERGRAFVRAVNAGISRIYKRVRVEPTRAVLTARQGTIPVTVTNAGEQRLTVVLRLTSPRVDLPATNQPLVLEPHRRTTQLLQVGTRTTGSFPIRVEVLTPDGKRRVAQADVTVVSTAFNRVALALAGGAAGFLLLWWRRGQRRRVGQEPGTGP
jgi:Family of unknown function (DUF6049)